MRTDSDMYISKFSDKDLNLVDPDCTDYWVLETLGNITQEGSFIEGGASMPSNCFNLERHYNWRGVCIEPTRHFYNDLLEYRDSICMQKCLYHENTKVDFLELSGQMGHLSHISESDSPYEKWNHNMIETGIKRTVDTITLDQVFDILKTKHVNFISLDIEGCEVDVINSWSNNLSADCLSIEGGYKVYETMQSKGYSWVYQPYAKTYHDHFFIHNRLIDTYKYKIYKDIDDFDAYTK
jgi:FkbM family methyltransferase